MESLPSSLLDGIVQLPFVAVIVALVFFFGKSFIKFIEGQAQMQMKRDDVGRQERREREQHFCDALENMGDVVKNNTLAMTAIGKAVNGHEALSLERNRAMTASLTKLGTTIDHRSEKIIEKVT